MTEGFTIKAESHTSDVTVSLKKVLSRLSERLPSLHRRNNVSNRFTFRLLIAKLIPLTLDVTSPRTDADDEKRRLGLYFIFALENRYHQLYENASTLFRSKGFIFGCCESFQFFFASRSTYFESRDWCLIHFQKFEASWSMVSLLVTLTSRKQFRGS